jgi:hypothetical protein
LDELHDRLLKVEKQNRRFKQFGVAALIVPALLLVMGQAESKKTIEANEFILRDSAGNIRAGLFMGMSKNRPMPMLALYDEKGEPSAVLNDEAIMFPAGEFPGVTITSDGITDIDQRGIAEISPNQMSVDDGRASYTSVGPTSLVLSDAQGFSAVLGATDLTTPRTGETHKTSAASLVLFDKSKDVIWEAP